MNIKKITYLFLFVLPVSCTEGQTAGLPKPAWNAAIKVIDESGEPVAGATAEMSWNVNRPDNSLTSDKTEGITDANGVFKTSHEANRSVGLGFAASKAGYYSAKIGYELAQLSDNDPAKWNPTVTLLLKKVIRPIPMYAKWVNLGMPAFDKPVGFDLMAGDWAAPYGKGANIDILFDAHREKRAEYDSDYKLTVNFPKAGDGIQEFSNLPGGSALRSMQQAPTDGYQPQWIQTKTARPGKGYSGNQDENRNYYFRVRTILDENGNVKSALYGKIYGDFMQFRYYLNPTPNDRNIEFDPPHNLFSEHDRGGANMDAP
jgi:hypothetical protein